MLTEVIPHLRLVRSLGRFDYVIPKHLERKIAPGDFVVIPWRGQRIPGIVSKLKNESDVDRTKLKTIHSVLDAVSPLTKINLELLEWFARSHGISPALALKTFVPHVPLRVAEFREPAEPRLLQSRIRVSELESLEETIRIAYDEPRTALRFPNAAFMRAWLYIFTKPLEAEEQILFCVPEIDDIALIQSILPHHLQARVAIFASGQAKNEYREARARVADGRASVIIGTKFSVFLPFVHLSHVVVFDESNTSHRQSEINPRFDPRHVAQKLAELHDATLTTAGSSTSLGTEFDIDQKKTVDISPAPPSVKIRPIQFAPEELKNPITEILAEKIQSTLATGKKVFCFLDKKGFSSILECQDCKTIAHCLSCNYILRVVKRGDEIELECHRCEVIQPAPATCAKCKGTGFRTRGWGVERVEKELQTLFPDARVQRIDGTSKEQPQHSTDIFVGTEYALRRLPWDDIATIGIIHVNGLLQLPSFEALERVWHLLFRLRFYLAGRDAGAQILLQTTDELPSFLLSLNREAFLRAEFENRKLLSYPPFGKLVVFRRSFANSDDHETQTDALIRRVSSLYPNATSISDPLVFKTAKQVRVRIILKFPRASHPTFDVIPDSWLVDVDPASLLS